MLGKETEGKVMDALQKIFDALHDTADTAGTPDSGTEVAASITRAPRAGSPAGVAAPLPKDAGGRVSPVTAAARPGILVASVASGEPGRAAAGSALLAAATCIPPPTSATAAFATSPSLGALHDTSVYDSSDATDAAPVPMDEDGFAMKRRLEIASLSPSAESKWGNPRAPTARMSHRHRREAASPEAAPLPDSGVSCGTATDIPLSRWAQGRIPGLSSGVSVLPPASASPSRKRRRVLAEDGLWAVDPVPITSSASAEGMSISATDAGSSEALRRLLEPARRPIHPTKVGSVAAAPPAGRREQFKQPSMRASDDAEDDADAVDEDDSDDATPPCRGGTDQPSAVPAKPGWSKPIDYALMGEAIMSGA